MTDLEMTRLAAEAIGYSIDREVYARIWKQSGCTAVMLSSNVCWDPLTDAAQAFELQEKLRMLCMVNIKDEWVCKTTGVVAVNIDLKRAIVECAARYALWKREQK